MLYRKKSSLLLLSFLLLSSFFASAKTYYFSSSIGNDNNSGTSSSSPWKSINKISSLSLNPGDQVLFQRGDTFYGEFSVTRSGTLSSPIVFGAYGSGEKPIISGFTTVKGWNNLGSNIWESSSSVSNRDATNMVVIDGVNTEMGKYPNSGYFTYKSFVGKESITDSEGLSGSPNWKGAELVLFVTTYVIERNPITSHSGNTLYYTQTSTNRVQRNGLRYFIQNDPKTLDMQNEWYFNPSTKKIRIYSNRQPSSVNVASIDHLIRVGGLGGSGTRYVKFENIALQGSNEASVQIRNGKYISILNCDFDFSGGNAIDGPYFGNSTGINIENNSINNSNNNAIKIEGDFDNATIKNNKINNTGKFAGMGHNGDNNSISIFAKGERSLIENNSVDNSGYIGIRFDGNYTTVQNNFVNNSLLIKVDGGGIYTWNGKGASRPVYVGRKVLNNIVLNTPNGTGIYMDDGVQGVELAGNTVAFCAYGIYIHGNQNMNVHNNTVYNCTKTQFLFRSEVNEELRDISFNNNIAFSRTASELNILWLSLWDDIPQFGTANNNYYARPMDDNTTIHLYPKSAVYAIKQDVAAWQKYTGQEGSSKKSPKTIKDVNDLRFEYNAGPNDKSISLDANYIDVKGKSYNGSIVLAPYTSAVLIKNGAATNQSPIANAGSDQTINLPDNSVNLSGSGEDPDGSISSYLWTKISGPSKGSISSNSSAKTSVTNLDEGVYEFELKVTDNKSATGTDIVKITVKSKVTTGTDPLTANAGNNQTISLPVNSVTLNGTGTGDIIGYEWRQIAGQNVTSSINSAQAVINGLDVGVYKFELKVTDSDNNTQRDTVTITVLTQVQSSGTELTANAGGNQILNLPIKSVVLKGSGTGEIIAYQWRQIAGRQVTSSINVAEAVVDGLDEGEFTFELKVTDVRNQVMRDTAIISVVKSSQNSGTILTANAGGNQILLLPENSVILDGSGTGDIVSYQWRQIEGRYVTSSIDFAKTEITGLREGEYKFELKVIDSKGKNSRDTMKVTVSNSYVLTSNAGPDQTLYMPSNVVSLYGSGTGNIVAYQWRQVSGPSKSTSSIDDQNAVITDLKEGLYEFELKVTDSKGKIDRDIVKVNVVGMGSMSSFMSRTSPGSSQQMTNDFETSSKTDVTKNSIAFSDKQINLKDSSSIMKTNQGLMEQPELSNNLKVYPNPIMDVANLEIYIVNPNSNVLIYISDIKGTTLFSKQIKGASGSVREKMNISNFANGIYTLTVIVNSVEKKSIQIIKL